MINNDQSTLLLYCCEDVNSHRSGGDTVPLIEGEEIFSEKTKIVKTLNSFFLNQQSNLNPISESDIVPPHLPSYTSVVNGEFSFHM